MSLEDKLRRMAKEEALKKMPDVNQEFYVDLLTGIIHTLCCQGPHGVECFFYQEEQMVDSEQQPSHLKWKGITQVLMEDAGLTEVRDITLLLGAMPQIIAWLAFPPPVIRVISRLMENLVERVERLEELTEGFTDEQVAADLRVITGALLPRSVATRVHETGTSKAEQSDGDVDSDRGRPPDVPEVDP